MTPAERQRKRREKLRAEEKKVFYVRGEGGAFDERIRVAYAVKQLVDKGLLSEDVVNMIINESSKVEQFSHESSLNNKYAKKIVSEYLKKV